MAESITPQDLENARRDIDDIGKAVNESVIVTPRYGAPFKSIPMSMGELQAAIESAATSGAGANGWTDLLIQTEDGSTQRAKNSLFQSQIDSKASTIHVDAQDANLQTQINGKASAEYLDSALIEQTQNVNTALSQLSTLAAKFYPTLAEANADISNIAIDQPVQVGESGASGGLYYKATAEATTLTKSPYDPLSQSKDYFNQAITIENTNLYIAALKSTSRYVNSSALIAAGTSVEMAVFPVEAGKTYAIKASSFGAGAFLIAFRGSNSTNTGETLGLATLNNTADASVKTFTTPVGATHAFINTYLPSLGFDIRPSIVINKGTTIKLERATKIFNVPISDEASLKDGDILLAGNLYSGTNQASRYVNSSGSIEANPATAMHVLPVIAGEVYTVKAESLPPAAFLIAFRGSASVNTGTTLGLATLNATKDLNTKSFTVPADATHAFINVLLPSFGLDIRNSLVIQRGKAIVEIGSITAIKGTAIVDTKAREAIENLDLSAESKLKGKTWVAIGDSITAENQRSLYKYHYYLSQNVGGMTVRNYGISGSGFFDRHGVAADVTQLNPDIVTVFMGTNDWGVASLPLGSFGDTGVGTIAGCINTTLLGLVTKFYKSSIAIFTPLPRIGSYGIDGGGDNAQGYHLSAIVDLLKKYAEHYSLPLIDLYSESNMHPWLPASNDYYFKPFEGSSYGSTPDGLHPNDAGHMLLARKIKPFLESL